MAKSAIPDPLARRHLLERELAEAHALKLAEAYRAEGREVEAVDFLRKGGDTAALEAVRRLAVEAGDAFLLRAVAAALDTTPGREEWLELESAARGLGKERYAAEARRYADRGEEE